MLHFLNEMKIKCKKCGDIIEGDRKGTLFWCSCESVGIDETIWYTRLLGDENDYEIVEEKVIK